MSFDTLPTVHSETAPKYPAFSLYQCHDVSKAVICRYPILILLTNEWVTTGSVKVCFTVLGRW